MITTIVQALLCGVSFSIGAFVCTTSLFWISRKQEKKAEDYRQESLNLSRKTVELLEARNAINERIAEALEDGAK